MAGTGTVWRNMPVRRGRTPAHAYFCRTETPIFIFKSEGEKSMPEQEVSLAQLAEALGVTVQRVEELATEGVIEQTRPGHARLSESIRRYNEDAEAEAWAEREVTIAELADVLNLTVQRVNQLAAEGIIEKTRHGHARFGLSVRRYVDYYVHYHVERATAKGRPEQNSLGERMLAERARKLKRENDEKEASLMKMTDVLTAIDVMVEIIQSGIASIPARVTDDPVLRGRIRDALEPVVRGLTERHRDATAALKQGRDPSSVINQEDGQSSMRMKGNRKAT